MLFMGGSLNTVHEFKMCDPEAGGNYEPGARAQRCV